MKCDVTGCKSLAEPFCRFAGMEICYCHKHAATTGKRFMIQVDIAKVARKTKKYLNNGGHPR